MQRLWRPKAVWIVATTSVFAAAGTLMAQTASIVSATDAPPAGYWIDGIHLSAQIEGGITFNPARPKENFGQLSTDRANQPMLNQVLLTAEKPLDPGATEFDWGFTLQGLYGSDARFFQLLGELQKAIGPASRNALSITEANVQLHAPVLTEGGIDIKIGQFSSPFSYERIDPASNPFYSHNYIFSWIMPFENTGFLTATHVSPLLDVYLGVDTGSSTTFGPTGANNSTIKFQGGFGLNLLGGDLTIQALTRFGAENAARGYPGINVDAYRRFSNDIVVKYKATPNLSFVTEVSLTRDELLGIGASGVPKPANAFGVAQYASYILTDTLTLNARAELFRDDNGIAVLIFPRNYDFVNLEAGLPNSVQGFRPTTYASVTLGVTYKPMVLAPVTGLLIRPEVRWDQALTGTHPFDRGTQDRAFTAASDFVLKF